jgi:hypothetical protein
MIYSQVAMRYDCCSTWSCRKMSSLIAHNADINIADKVRSNNNNNNNNNTNDSYCIYKGW